MTQIHTSRPYTNTTIHKPSTHSTLRVARMGVQPTLAATLGVRITLVSGIEL